MKRFVSTPPRDRPLGDVLATAFPVAHDPIAVARTRASVMASMFDAPAAPLRIGRYVILEPAGRGGMGAVWVAYDPMLNRRVAVKVLRLGHAAKPEAMRSEAQALAQLAHPNVVRVFEVGTTEQADPYLVMEYVPGPSLRTWASRGRSPAQVLSTYVALGHGLAAVHERGLVHGDVKPGNIVVGPDRRPRLVDFGLATSVQASVGGRGTPGYLAPELAAGAPSSPSSDQYAFSRSVRQALDAIPDAATSVGPAVLRALDRGMLEAPGQRWPDMHALLAALGRRRWRPRLMAGAVTIAVAATLVAGSGLLDAPVTTCEIGAWAADEWTEPDRARVSAALAESGVPGSDDVARRTIDEIDTRVQAWHEARQTICAEAETRADATFPTPATSRCLALRRAELVQLIETLGRADADVAARAVRAASGLASPRRCVDDPPQAPEPRVHPIHLDESEYVHQRVAQARVARQAADFEGATAILEPLLHELERWNEPALTAMVLLEAGMLAWNEGDRDQAESRLEVAAHAARSAGADRLAVHAASRIAMLLTDRGALVLAARWVRTAEAWARASGRDMATVAAAAGRLAYGRGDHGDARRHFARTVDAMLAEDEREGPRLAKARANLAQALHFAGEAELAIAELERSLAVLESSLGPEHPDTVGTHLNLARMLAGQDRLDAARRHLAVGDEIATRRLSEDHPMRAALSLQGGMVEHRAGDFGASATRYEQARARYEAAGDSRGMVRAQAGVAAALAAAGALEEAIAAARAGLDLGRALTPPGDEALLCTDTLAQLLLRAGRADEAAPVIEAGLALAPPGSPWIDRLRALQPQISQ